MSRVNKHKHVMQELDDYDFQPPAANQQFARVVRSRGNNLHEVQPEKPAVLDNNEIEETFLVTMPAKFRKNIWIKRGNFLIVEMIAEGNKVKAEIVRILMPEHVKEFKKDGIWPAQFDDRQQNVSNIVKSESASSHSSDSDDSDDDLVRNTNGWHGNDTDSSDTEDEDQAECLEDKFPSDGPAIDKDTNHAVIL